MKTAFQTSFAKDLRSIKDRGLHDRVADLIQTIEQAADLTGDSWIEKAPLPGSYYRVRLGDYRVGLAIREGVVSFVRCLHRKEIYRYFP